MVWILLALLVVIIILLVLDYKKQVNIKTINTEIEEKNAQLEEEHNKWQLKIECAQQEIQRLTDSIAAMGVSAEQSAKTCNEIFQRAFEQYTEILEQQYQEKEEEYDNLNRALEEHYNEQQDAYMQTMEDIQADLNKIKRTRTAVIEAQIRERKIKEDAEFYCLKISEIDLADIKILEKVKEQLNKPRILCMLIWSTFFQKPMTSLCNDVLGAKETKTGIYKITNQKTKECYIGQAVDISNRWKEHAKCGLGIDTPVSNKLYKAMQEYGIWNFSWELLEECPRELLNEKEAYYIELYDSKNYGYNTTIGVKKS